MKQKISCIYLIFNNINKHFYLGSTVNFFKRVNEHKNALLKNKHHSKYLQRAVNKYGIENFIFIILQETNDNRLEIEQFYLNTLNPQYNVSLFAHCPMEGRKHTKEAKLKMSKRLFGNKYCLGKKASLETKLKMSISHMGSKRNSITKKKMSETAKQINSISRIDRTIRMRKIIDKNNIIYNSLQEAANINNYSVQAVCDNLKGRSKTTWDGNYFKYYIKEENES